MRRTVNPDPTSENERFLTLFITNGGGWSAPPPPSPLYLITWLQAIAGGSGSVGRAYLCPQWPEGLSWVHDGR